MKVIDILNKLEEGGQLTSLYQAGIINIRCYSQRDIYLRYQTLKASLKYEKDNAGAVQRTAEEFDVSVRTVYAAVRAMQSTLVKAA